MKFFVFIFSFYTLALSCFPCADSGECNVNAGQKISIATQHPDHQQEASACSPFCSCNCCPGFDFSLASLHIEYLVLSSAEKLAAYLPATISGIALPIWQPPKMS